MRLLASAEEEFHRLSNREPNFHFASSSSKVEDDWFLELH